MVYGIYLYTSTIWILKNRSTIHLLYLSSDHQIDVIHFDFEKAFDSVPHNELWNVWASPGSCGYGIHLIISSERMKVNVYINKNIYSDYYLAILK